jgi:hypothetical protein
MAVWSEALARIDMPYPLPVKVIPKKEKEAEKRRTQQA